MKKIYVLIIALFISVSALVLAVEDQEKPTVTVFFDENPVYNQQKITHTSSEGILEASGSKNIQSVLINVRENGKTIISNQSTNPFLYFTLPNGTYEVNVIGYTDNQWAASAKILLEIHIPEQPKQDAQQQTTNSEDTTKESFTDVCNSYDQRREDRAYQKGDTYFKILYSNQEELNYTQRYQELEKEQEQNHFVFLKDSQGRIHARGANKQEKTHLETFSNKRFEVRLAEDFCTQINEVVTTYQPQPQEPQEVCAQQTKEQLRQARSKEEATTKAQELLETECETIKQTLQNKLIAIQALQRAGEDTQQVLAQTITQYEANLDVREEILDLYFLYANELLHVSNCYQLQELQKKFLKLQPTNKDKNLMKLTVSKCAQKSGTCEVYQGDPNAPIPILFVADKYESMQPFYEDIDDSIQTIFENNLFREHKKKFSFSYFDKILYLPSDTTKRFESFIEPTIQETRHCVGHPVLLSRDEFRSFARFSVGSAISWPHNPERVVEKGQGYKMIYGGSGSEKTVLHEIGHQIFHLSDLYEEKEKGSQPSFTCQTSMKKAREAWSHIPAAEYHYGCAFIKENVRSAEKSVMRSEKETLQFDPASAYLVRQKLESIKI